MRETDQVKTHTPTVEYGGFFVIISLCIPKSDALTADVCRSDEQIAGAECVTGNPFLLCGPRSGQASSFLSLFLPDLQGGFTVNSFRAKLLAEHLEF